MMSSHETGGRTTQLHDAEMPCDRTADILPQEDHDSAKNIATSSILLNPKKCLFSIY